MPWHIVPESAKCPASKPFAVVKDADGSVAGCHPTKAAAMKQMAALYANEAPMNSTAPVDNLIRSLYDRDDSELRAQVDGADGGTLYGHFAVFNQWTEINSMREGQFMERIAPGALADTMRTRGNKIKVLYDHGQDPSQGNRPLGSIRSMAEDKIGASYAIDLLRKDTGDLVPFASDFLVPAAKAGLLGASFRFQVAEESWNDTPKPSTDNPTALRERTITRIDPLYEFGPVTFPAYEAATAAVRSGTDRFLRSVLTDPMFVARMTEQVGADIVEQIIAVASGTREITAAAAVTEYVAATEALERATDGPPEGEEQTTEATTDGLPTWNPEAHRIAQHRQSTAAFDAHLTRWRTHERDQPS